MIFDVTKPLPQRIEFGGKKYALDLSYNKVLDVYALMREDKLYDEEKNAFALALLVKEKYPPPMIIKKIFDENKMDIVIHLAAIAGVRLSIEIHFCIKK